MMKRIAIVTGASSGIGRVFAMTAADKICFDELWVIARRAERLEALAEDLKDKAQVIPMPLDLEKQENVLAVRQRLEAEQATVVLLVNAAGFGKFGTVTDVDNDTANRMLALNCTALMNMCYACIHYMQAGAKILNVASVAAFQPVPYICEYAATKAFVLSFSRGLWKELRPKGITVTALCPYWTKTGFFDVAQTKSGKEIVHYYNAMYQADDVVNRGWRDLLKGRDVSTYGFIARLQLIGIKVLPHRLVMWIWCRQQGIKQ